MIDTFLIVAPWATHIPVLDREKEEFDRDSGLVTLTGWYRNLRVTIKPDGEVVIGNSLPKYYCGSNVRTMRFGEVRDAVSELIGAFGIDPIWTKVCRLDLGATMQMTRPVSQYLSLLGDLPRTHPHYYESGKEWITDLWTISAYDKAIESNCEGNLLRIEDQLKKKVARQLGRALSLADLVDYDTFVWLTELWAGWYHRIPKLTRQVLVPTRRTKELDTQLAREALEQRGGVAELRRVVEGWPLDTRERSRMLGHIRDLGTGGNLAIDRKLISELDERVESERRLALVR
ncbi:MAG: hypothetical protein IH855_05635 [Bacteroidetes bacterium]|nr:hypothetical protein [Bacteroidota bacterium]